MIFSGLAALKDKPCHRSSASAASTREIAFASESLTTALGDFMSAVDTTLEGTGVAVGTFARWGR